MSRSDRARSPGELAELRTLARDPVIDSLEELTIEKHAPSLSPRVLCHFYDTLTLNFPRLAELVDLVNRHYRAIT